MPEPCSTIEALAPELIRGRELDRSDAEHVASCEACKQVVAGARALARDLGTLEAPEPSADLVARTLARVRLSGAVAAEPEPAPALEPARPRRRTAAQLLETWALPGPAPRVAAPPERIWLRIAIQAAAAVVIFAVCTFSALELYPAYVEALEEKHVEGCQAHLRVLESAVGRYAKDHPDAAKQGEPLQGLALREALVRGGYAKDEDFLCPSMRGVHAGQLCYFIRLPDARTGRAVAWDRFGNHGGGALNVVRQGGKPELLEGGRLWAWLTEERQ